MFPGLGGKGRKGPGSPVESLKGALEMSRTHGVGSVDCMGTNRSELRPVSVLERKPVDLWVPVINPFVYGSGGVLEKRLGCQLGGAQGIVCQMVLKKVSVLTNWP